MISGSQRLLPKKEETAACQVAAELALENPEWFYRNPSHLERGHQLARYRFDTFVARNGRPWFSGTPTEVSREINAFNAFRVASKDSNRPRAMDWPPVLIRFPEGMFQQSNICMFMHPSMGIIMFSEAELICEALEEPELACRSPWRDVLLSFLSGAGVLGGRAFEGIGMWNPDLASAVFRQLTGRSDFDWNRDGGELLQSFSLELAADPGWPTEMALPSRLARAMMARTGSNKGPKGAKKRRTPKGKR